MCHGQETAEPGNTAQVHGKPYQWKNKKATGHRKHATRPAIHLAENAAEMPWGNRQKSCHDRNPVRWAVQGIPVSATREICVMATAEGWARAATGRQLRWPPGGRKLLAPGETEIWVIAVAERWARAATGRHRKWPPGEQKAVGPRGDRNLCDRDSYTMGTSRNGLASEMATGGAESWWSPGRQNSV